MYGFNLKRIAMDEFRGIIEEGYLIPSMRLLKEDIHKRFDIIEAQGLENVFDLSLALKNQKMADQLAEVTGIDSEYMTALRRLVSSYKPKARKLEEFPDINEELYSRMVTLGIKTSKSLFLYFKDGDPDRIAQDLSIAKKDIDVLKSLMEVTQLRYVSPLFATAMVRSGYDSIALVAAGEKEAFLQALKSTNASQQIYKGNIGDTDIQFLIDDAKVFLRHSH